MYNRILTTVLVFILVFLFVFSDFCVAAQLSIDTSSSSSGVFTVSVEDAVEDRYILSMENGGEECYFFIRTDGVAEIFPITLGDGWYTATLLEHYFADYYNPVDQRGFVVTLDDNNSPWLSPSRFVPFDEDSKVVALAAEICDGLETEEEKYEAVCTYARRHFIYDHIKVLHSRYDDVTAAPDIDRVVDKGLGTCLDLSSTMVAMLRSQGIVSKLVYGRANNYAHAWTVSIINGEERMFDPSTNTSKNKEYVVINYY